MCIEGNDVAYAHLNQLFEHHRAVKGFTTAALVLASFI